MQAVARSKFAPFIIFAIAMTAIAIMAMRATAAPTIAPNVVDREGYCHSTPCFYYIEEWAKVAKGDTFVWKLPSGSARLGQVDLRGSRQKNIRGTTTGYAFVVLDTFRTSPGLLFLGTHLEENLTRAGRDAIQTRLDMDTRPVGTNVQDMLWGLLTTEAKADGLDRNKPLMPNRRGSLELYLGGHSIIQSEPFSIQDDKVIQVLHDNYVQVRSDVERGWLPPGHHQRYLTTLEEKYDVDSIVFLALWGEPYVESLPHNTTQTESWNCDDSDNPDCDLDWTEISSDFDIVSNKLAADVTNNNTFIREEDVVSTDDHFVEVDVNFAGEGSEIEGGPASRFAAAASTFYVCWLDSNGDLVELYEVTAGSYSEITTAAFTVATSTDYKAEILSDGSSHSCLVDDSEIISPQTDTSITGNVRGGLHAFNGDHTYDDFLISDTGAPATRRVIITRPG